MMDVVAFSYGCIFREAGDPVPPISSVFDVPTVPQVWETVAYAIQNSKCGNGGN